MDQISLPEFEPEIGAESILVFESQPEDEESLIHVLAGQVPTANIVGVRSLEEYRRLAQQQPFDVVVLDQELSGARSLEFVLELRLKDIDPAIMVVLAATHPQDVAALYNAG